MINNIYSSPEINYLLRVNHKPFDSLLTYFFPSIGFKNPIVISDIPILPASSRSPVPPVLSIQETAHQKDTQRFEPRGWGGQNKIRLYPYHPWERYIDLHRLDFGSIYHTRILWVYDKKTLGTLNQLRLSAFPLLAKVKRHGAQLSQLKLVGAFNLFENMSQINKLDHFPKKVAK